MDSNIPHIPVLLNECIDGLNIKPNGIYIDCTCGYGGHSEKILEKLTTGKLIGFDKDITAVNFSKERLKKYGEKFSIIQDDFKNAISHLNSLNIDKIDGVLMDLGVSSLQLDDKDRGFSYVNDGKLDMRMNQNQSFSAYDVVNGYSEKELADVIYEFGEDKLSRIIASRIVEARKIKPIETTLELAEIVQNSYPIKTRYKFGNPSKRTFQAIRIEVNSELDGLSEIIEKLAKRLKNGGRICVISFHSLEDRIVKRTFENLNKTCICPPELPVCICNKVQEVLLVNKKPITATENELKNNKRAESAKLRIAERINGGE